jgi:hypothetical protein
MRSETRIARFLRNFSESFKEKFSFFQMSFSSAIFFLFSGFLGGNLFGTFLNAIRTLIPWDGFIVVSFLFFVEIISYIRYHNEGRFFLILWKFPFSYKKRIFWKNFNFLKIGLMLGFFIDAFKVGS